MSKYIVEQKQIFLTKQLLNICVYIYIPLSRGRTYHFAISCLRVATYSDIFPKILEKGKLVIFTADESSKHYLNQMMMVNIPSNIISIHHLI